VLQAKGDYLRAGASVEDFAFGSVFASEKASLIILATLRAGKLTGENSNEEAKGFLADRTADRGGHHPDHCSYRYS
jgi:hypothetical protein